MPRIPYDPTLVALTTPGLRETLFQDASFRGAGPDAICAECARLAYVDFDVVPGPGMGRLTDALALIGFGAPTAIVDADTGTEAFATLTPEGRVLVSFRGTQPDQVKDLLADANAWLVPWREGGKVHKGFSKCFDSVSAKVEEALRRATSPSPPIFTGHSLGAAIATLAASTFKGATLVTFGSPRVGDPAFVATLEAAAIHRYVDCSDFVTKVPPPLPGLYTHCNDDPLYIDRFGDIRRKASGFSKLVDQFVAGAAYLWKYAFRAGNVPAKTFADHSPINYIRAFTSEP